MSKVLQIVGRVSGRAFSQPLAGTPGDAGVKPPEDYDPERQTNVSLTIQLGVPVKSGDMLLFLDELHPDDFVQGGDLDIYIGPKGFAQEAMDRNTSQSTEIANLTAELSRLRVQVDQYNNSKAAQVPPPSQPNAPTAGTGGTPNQQTGETPTT